MTQTLPETLVGAIKALVGAHRDYVAVVEELQALGQSVRGDLDRLVIQQEKLADISLVSKGPVTLPKAIVPREERWDAASREEGAA